MIAATIPHPSLCHCHPTTLASAHPLHPPNRRLNISPRPAVSAFLSGFYELIPLSWVAMFSGEELQTLISGSEERLDLDDMRASVVYAGGYHEGEPGGPGWDGQRRLPPWGGAPRSNPTHWHHRKRTRAAA